MNTDELLAEMMRDELEGATKLTPIDYAKLRGLRPQKVYAAIRNGKLDRLHCECGRKVVDVDAADKLFAKGANQTDQTEEEVSGSELDSSE